jgi:hypothetical protein
MPIFRTAGIFRDWGDMWLNIRRGEILIVVALLTRKSLGWMLNSLLAMALGLAGTFSGLPVARD